MPSQLETAFANFKKMKPAEIKQLDDTLAFLTHAQMPTYQGAVNRALLQSQPVNPEAMKAIGAYRAYKFKLEHKPMDDTKAALMKLQGVPDAEIAHAGSREKWEQDQLGAFDKLSAMTAPDVTMGPETITASVAKKPHAKPKVEKMDMMRAVPAAMPPAAPPAAAGAEGAAMPAPAPSAPAPMPQPEPQAPLYAAPPAQLEQQKVPLGAALGGQLA